MTPAEKQEFIRLWTQGLETAEIARQLGIPQGTVSSWANALQKRGLIEPRPRGGLHNRRVAQARQAGAPAPTRGPPHLPAPTREAPAMTLIAVAEVQEILSTLKRLDARVEALEQTKFEPPAAARACGHPPANA